MRLLIPDASRGRNANTFTTDIPETLSRRIIVARDRCLGRFCFQPSISFRTKRHSGSPPWFPSSFAWNIHSCIVQGMGMTVLASASGIGSVRFCDTQQQDFLNNGLISFYALSSFSFSRTSAECRGIRDSTSVNTHLRLPCGSIM